MSTNEIHDRLAELTPRLMAYSHFVKSPEMDNEDVRQEMYLAVLERAGKDPEFVSKLDTYISWFATWAAKNKASATYTYDKHIAIELDDDDDEKIDDLSSSEEDPAKIYENNESLADLLEIISSLSKQNRTIIKMVFLGYSGKEIAEKLNITPAAVSMRRMTIIKAVGNHLYPDSGCENLTQQKIQDIRDDYKKNPFESERYVCYQMTRLARRHSVSEQQARTAIQDLL